jgi:hypothetical protein
MLPNGIINHEVDFGEELSALLNEFGNELSSNERFVEVVFAKLSNDMTKWNPLSRYMVDPDVAHGFIIMQII